jgi:glycosyltransferase involved in cell wall biosynthesis
MYILQKGHKRKKKLIRKPLNNKLFKSSKFSGFHFKYVQLLKIVILLSFFIYYFIYFRKPKTIEQYNDNNNINDNYNNRNNILSNSKQNNKGFLKITTIHKSKYEKYNYKENIIVYKDIYNDITYTPIDESNAIIKSDLVGNKTYYELCQQQTLLDKTKYKRSAKPKISVITPMYNKDKFSIYISLRSIQNQSLKDIEIILVDDGSSENKINEVLEEMKNDNRIILLKHKENKGTLMSRVDGVRYASGEYILNLDQDDLFLNNHLFENLYNKAKEINVDILQFTAVSNNNGNRINIMETKVIKNVLVKQPELRYAFLEKIGENRYSWCSTRMIWDKMVRREVYLEAIEDLGDEYLNHRFFFYEDTLMMFELSQIAYSYYYYDILGYQFNVITSGRSRDSTSQKGSILAMNQLYFIKLLLYKINPSFNDRYNIFKEWGFGYCGSEVRFLDRSEMDLLLEVLEVIDELERIYKNTDKELLSCENKIKKNFGIIS